MKKIIYEIITEKQKDITLEDHYIFIQKLLYFWSGLTQYNKMKDYKLVKQGGAWYTYTTRAGEDVKFLSKDFENTVREDPELETEIYEEICNAYIFKYKPGENIGIDDIEIAEDFTSEED